MWLLLLAVIIIFEVSLAIYLLILPVDNKILKIIIDICAVIFPFALLCSSLIFGSLPWTLFFLFGLSAIAILSFILKNINHQINESNLDNALIRELEIAEYVPTEQDLILLNEGYKDQNDNPISNIESITKISSPSLTHTVVPSDSAETLLLQTPYRSSYQVPFASGFLNETNSTTDKNSDSHINKNVEDSYISPPILPEGLEKRI